MTKKQCPLGEDCDLTIAWMKGAEDARDKAKARIEALEAKLAETVQALNTAANWIDYCAGMMPDPLAKATIRSWADQTRTIAAELTGDNP